MAKDLEDSSKEKDALKEHEIASKVVKGSGYGNATLLVGYIGKSDDDKSVRLYMNLNFDEYVQVPRESILHAANAPESVLPFGGTYLWIKKDDHITYVRVDSTKQQAKFLEGSISQGLSPSESVQMREAVAPRMLRPRPRRSNDDRPCIASIDFSCPHTKNLDCPLRRTPDIRCGHPRASTDLDCPSTDLDCPL